MVSPGRDRLSGIIEVDKAYIGGPELGKRGRGAAGKALIVIAAQKNGKRIRRIRLKHVPNTSAKSLDNAVKNSVEPNSTIRTDDWNRYNQLSKLGYNHNVIHPRILHAHTNYAQNGACKILGLPRLKRKTSSRFCPAALRADFALQNPGS